MHTEQRGLPALFALARILLRSCKWGIAALALAWFSVSATPVVAQSGKADRAPAAKHAAAVTPRTPKAPVQVALPAPPPSRFVPGFAEALVATGEVTTDENADLDAAVKAFHDAPAAAGKDGDYSDYAKPFLKFLEAHPKSAWNASILTNLGLGYFHAGYFTDATDAWKKAWELGKDAKTEQARMVAGRAAGELAHVLSQTGQEKPTEAILGDLAKHPVGGPATELVQGAKDALWSYHNNPGMAFRCGPTSLSAVLMTLKADKKALDILEKARSGPHGFNLKELSALAGKAGFKHRLIHREAGQPIPVPSVIHWSINHYAALTRAQDGLYEVKDSAFGGSGSLMLTKKAIEKGSSGYFLIPADLKGAWRKVSANSPEAEKVFGMDNPTTSMPEATRAYDFKISNCPGCNAPPSMIMAQCPACTTPAAIANPRNRPPQMAIADAHAMTVSLNIKDTPVGYDPQKGYSALTTVTYNAREAMQPATFTFSNLSSKWTHSWQAYIIDDPAAFSLPVRIASGGGGYTTLGSYFNGQFTTGERTDNSVLFRTPVSGTATQYIRHLSDGGFENYTLSDGAASFPRKMFLTSVVDPQGNTTTINYDGTFRITTVVDAMGRSTTFTYGLAGFPLLITQITDPFGRSASFTYDTSQRLASITDPAGITSTFSYSAVEPTFIKSMTTPYGTSNFSDMVSSYDASATNTRSLTLTDPLGFTDWMYYYQNPNIVANPDPRPDPVGMAVDTENSWVTLNYRNAFYWDKHAYALSVNHDNCNNPVNGDFTKARLIHWIMLGANLPLVSVTSTIMPPLEWRTYLDYPGQIYPFYEGTLDRPQTVGRVLDDGSSQLTKATYYPYYGHPLTVTDPVGRVTQYLYENGTGNYIDLTRVQQQTAPFVFTDIATYGAYNALHEPQTYKGADGKTWNYTYNAAGQLLTVQDPNLKFVTYSYDPSSRLSTITNQNTTTVLTLTYDSADRVRTKTDSQGYVLTYDYDNLDRVTQITYPDATTDLYDYTFQSGPLVGTPSLELRKHTDRLGRITTYTYDADRRLTSVVEPTSDNLTTRTTSYDYYENGALKNLTDANGNVTHWDIDIESRPTAKTYQFGTASAKTETYAYETRSPRLKSITDPLGQVKTFTYNKDDTLAGIAYTGAVNPTPNVTFAYDPRWPRRTSMTDGTGTTNYGYVAVNSNGGLKLSSVTGPYGANSTFSIAYDNMGRVSGYTIPGGNEGFTYDDINRVATHTTPVGTFTYSYLGDTGQTTGRTETTGGITVSTNWAYDTNANDRRLLTITNSGVSRSYTLGYGSANPYDILSIDDTAAATHPWATQSHAYTFDFVDRLLTTTATTPGNTTYVYDNLDSPTTWTDSTGTTNPTFNGFNQIATWGALNYVHDDDGNTISGDGAKTYKWDAENRLYEIDYTSGDKTNFTYDGLNRRVVAAETVSGVTTAKHFLWCGAFLCQTRDGATDIVTRRDMLEGELNVTLGQKLIYMPDQLNSVRDVIDATTGLRVQSYDYAPYGAVARSDGSTPTDYQYAGLFLHAASNLNFGAYREMDGKTGRWLSRDPIKEMGGINLYNYVAANTVSRIDPRGLAFGDLLPIPPGYNPTLWNIAKFDEGAPVQRDPVTGKAYVSQPELAGRWRHWDVREDKGMFNGRCPLDLRKPWPNGKRPPYDDQPGSWPEMDFGGWMPPPTDTYSGSLSTVAIPGDIYNPWPAFIMPNGEPPFDWY